MSQNLNNPSVSRPDYGAISSSSSNVPAVDFASFSPTEFVSLSEDIAHNISGVHSVLKQLEKILKNIEKATDQHVTREKVHAINGKTNLRIEETSRDLQRLTLVVGRGDKRQKLQLIKLTTDFRNVVNKYSELQQRVAAAMQAAYPPTFLLQQEDEDAASNMQNAESLLQQQQQQLQMNANLEMEQESLLQRAREIEQIETDVLDVYSIMCTLSNILQGQREQTDAIETNVESGASNVESGLTEIVKAAQSRSRYRKKMIILLIIAVIIGIIVTVVLVGKLKN